MRQQELAVAQTNQPLHFSLRSLLVAVAVSAALLFVLVWLANNFRLFTIFPEVEPKPFDQKLWKAWSIEDMHQSNDIRRALARRDMLDDLLAKHSFAGLKQAELSELLGLPSPEFCPPEWDVAYLLGMDWVDYVVLVFRLDREGRVESYQVIMF